MSGFGKRNFIREIAHGFFGYFEVYRRHFISEFALGFLDTSSPQVAHVFLEKTLELINFLSIQKSKCEIGKETKSGYFEVSKNPCAISVIKLDNSEVEKIQEVDPQ